MQQLQKILSTSLVWRWFCALCSWFEQQWHQSAIVSGFLTLPAHGAAVSRNSTPARLFDWLRRLLCALYERLKLERIFEGSIFTHTAIWCILPVVLAPLIPTMALLALSLVALCAVTLHLLRNPDISLAYAPANRYVLFYCLLYLAGTLLSTAPRSSLNVGLLTIAFILTSLVIQNGITTKRALDALIALFVLSATAVALYGIYQYLFQAGYQSSAWVDSAMFAGISFRVPSTLDNPNMLGLFFILAIPFGGAQLLRARTNPMRALYFVCCALMCLCMLLTFSRGAWLGLLAAGLVFILLLNPRLIVLAPIALVLLYFILPETVISRFTSIGDMGDSSTSYRVYIWMATLEMLRDYWFCGIGPGDVAFNTIYPIYSFNGIVAPHTHNLFLQIITDAGITALIVFCAVLVQFFRHLCAAIGRSDRWESRILQIACVSSVAGFLVQSLTDYSFYNHRIMFLFWAILSIGALIARRESLPEGGAL